MRKILWMLAIFFIGSHAFAEEQVAIRLLAIKHSVESMADGDAELAITAVKHAAEKGLNIRGVGNHFANRDGKIRVYKVDFGNSIERFQQLISDEMKTSAEVGDTFVLFTIGHGFEDGKLHNLGTRSEVMHAIAAAAEENDQRTLWWQLSCHATAGLPQIGSLPQSQQDLLSMYASSTAEDLSQAGVQGKIMDKVFMALAENTKIDDNKDGSVTAQEMKAFLTSEVSDYSGRLFFASQPNSIIFGPGFSLANSIPVVDRNQPQGKYPKNYIPKPGRF